MRSYEHMLQMLAVAWITSCGCAAPVLVTKTGIPEAAAAPGTGTTANAATRLNAGDTTTDAAGSKTAAEAAVYPPDSPQSLMAMLNDLQSLRDMDAPAYERLRADLERTDPKFWPAMVQSFRAALAYRQRQLVPPSPRQDALAAAGPMLPARHAEPASHSAEPAAKPPLQLGTLLAANNSIPNHATVPAAAQATLASVPVPLTQPAETMPPAPGDWQQQLAATQRALEDELARSPNLATGDRRQAYLRLLHLVAGQRDAALRPIPGIEAAEQEFWSQELFGLSKYLDIPAQPDRTRRAAEAARYLNEATCKLGQLATLSVRNITFCSEVSSYGVFTRFEKETFQPGQQVLLYAEVENFTSEATPKGHHTALSSSYQIFDSRGQRIEQHEFPLTEEYCINPRHDFFIRYFLRIPEQIYDGPHTLQLTIEDTLGQKVAQAKIDFQIKRVKPAEAQR